MSCLAKSDSKYLSKSDMERFYFAEDDDDFDFQYVPVNHFKHIVKDVKRQRVKEEEERAWALFLKEQEENYKKTYVAARRKSSRTLSESIEDVDRELLRLEVDNLPETNGQLCKNYQEKNSVAKISKNSSTQRESCTGSTNLLITIPEEENVCCSSRSTRTQRHSKSQIRKTHSDQTLKKNHICTTCNHFSDLNYNTSPDLSPDRFIDEDDLVPVRPDPDAAAKILTIQKKISIVLNSISYELDRVPLPDGQDDLLRRQQRVAEFSTRLSRNYLYDLGRQITDIQRHIKAITPNKKMKVNRRGIILHMQAIEQKLITAHQLLLTALTAYWKHIPTSVLKNHPGKLKEILQTVMHLRDICTEVKITPEFYCSGGDNGDVYLRKDTENQCTLILSKFRILSDNESQAPSHRTKSTTVTTSQNKKQKNRKALSNRLSMYTMDMRLARHHQPRKSYSMFHLSKGKKHNLLSKQQKNVLMGSKKSHPTLLTKSMSEHQTVGRTNRITVPVKEDDIQTIMETVPSNVEIQSPRSSVITKKSVNTADTKKSISIDLNTKEPRRLSKTRCSNERGEKTSPREEECLSTLLPVIGDLLSLVQSKSNDSKTLPMTSMIYNILQKTQTAGDQEKNRSNGENMQLICFSESEEKERIIDLEKHKERVNDASCQANYLKNGKKCDLSVPEAALHCLMDYKSQYQTFLKENPMYASNTQNKPWDLVAWIADKLIEELIADLSDDFQLEDVIKKLFELEFQEF